MLRQRRFCTYTKADYDTDTHETHACTTRTCARGVEVRRWRTETRPRAPHALHKVARRLIDIEEHEYALATDEVPYVASCQGRFNNPEIIAVVGDVVRRMRLLKGTRAATCRNGFDFDLKALGRATSARSALSWARWCEACGGSKAPGRPPAEKASTLT